MQINQVFDELHDDYTAKIMRWVPCYQNMVLDIAQYFPTGFQPPRILDLGCGNGITSQVLLRAFPQAQYTLVDASAEMIAGCQARFAAYPKFSYRQAFFQELDFNPQSFDLIVACLSIHHLQDAEKQAFFQKLQPWLAPEGRFLYSDLMLDPQDEAEHQQHLSRWKADATQQGTDEEEWTYLMDHYHTYDFPADLHQQIAWLKRTGFQQVDIAFREKNWTSLLISN